MPGSGEKERAPGARVIGSKSLTLFRNARKLPECPFQGIQRNITEQRSFVIRDTATPHNDLSPFSAATKIITKKVILLRAQRNSVVTKKRIQCEGLKSLNRRESAPSGEQ